MITKIDVYYFETDRVKMADVKWFGLESCVRLGGTDDCISAQSLCIRDPAEAQRVVDAIRVAFPMVH